MKIRKLVKEAKLILSTKHSLRNILLLSYFSVSSAVFGLAVFITYYPPPVLFPFDDPLATYTVNKMDDTYYMSYRSNLNSGISGIAIGQSPVNLEPLLRKRVKADGEFAFSNKQCITNYCKNIERSLVVNIKSIEEVDLK